MWPSGLCFRLEFIYIRRHLPILFAKNRFFSVFSLNTVKVTVAFRRNCLFWHNIFKSSNSQFRIYEKCCLLPYITNGKLYISRYNVCRIRVFNNTTKNYAFYVRNRKKYHKYRHSKTRKLELPCNYLKTRRKRTRNSGNFEASVLSREGNLCEIC